MKIKYKASAHFDIETEIDIPVISFGLNIGFSSKKDFLYQKENEK